MSVDAFFDSIDPDPRSRLTRLAWRAEVLADIEEKTAEVARRFGEDAYAGAGPQTREAVGRLRELAELHAGDDLSDPAAVAALAAALSSATATVRAIEDRGASGADPAEAAAP